MICLDYLVKLRYILYIRFYVKLKGIIVLMEKINIGFVGAGNMAGAIIDAILASEILPKSCLHIYDTSAERTAFYQSKGLNIETGNREMIEKCELIFLAVKPQVIDLVVEEIAGITSGKCIVSIAAGITIDRLKKSLGEDTHLIRVLPNTPMLVLKGATVIAKPDGVPKKYFDLVMEIFQAAGTVEILEESQINEVIPVSSSSPAFFFRMVRAMAQAGAAHGLEYEVALKLAVSTMHGASHIMMESGKTPDQLIDQVSSKGGTTVAALTAFDEFGYENLINQAFDRCIRRAEELGG